MKPSNIQDHIAVSLEKIAPPFHASFYTGVYKQAYFSGIWHYHPEFELLLITGGSGKRWVGDHEENFAVNDLVLLGSLLPHAWISDSKYLKEDSQEYCESIYVQFRKDVFGSYFLDIPELKGIRKILRLAEFGIKIKGEHKEKIINLLKEIPTLSPFYQLLSLLNILNLTSLSTYEQLASAQYLKNNFYFKSGRMIKIHDYIMENYKKEIKIKDCAEIANMTLPSFCRFFKKETSVTFSNYLHRIRIDFSKKLLLNTNLAIKEIAYECGYHNIPYFNKQFKKIVGASPLRYRKLEKSKA